ncbi:atherin-like [Sarcophilus harrisii]|uniref:atherin-like n=1 Tax=Sarcophilus harrisii TaxID=9305 RepID=UPI001301EF99|nr:atherin-like [Sarcophilus harrisii]
MAKVEGDFGTVSSLARPGPSFSIPSVSVPPIIALEDVSPTSRKATSVCAGPGRGQLPLGKFCTLVSLRQRRGREDSGRRWARSHYPGWEPRSQGLALGRSASSALQRERWESEAAPGLQAARGCGKRGWPALREAALSGDAGRGGAGPEPPPLPRRAGGGRWPEPISGAARLSDGSPPPLARSRRCLRPLSVQRSRLRLPFFSLLPLHRHLAAFALVPGRPARCLVGRRRLRPRLAPVPARRAALSPVPGAALPPRPPIHCPPAPARPPPSPLLASVSGRGRGRGPSGSRSLALLPSRFHLPRRGSAPVSCSPHPHPRPPFPSRRRPGALRGSRERGSNPSPAGRLLMLQG